MKTRFLAVAFCCLIVSLLSSCDKAKGETAEEAGVDKEAIKSEIIAMESAYADAMNLGDANGAAKYYADDAKSYHSGFPAVEGKEAIIADLRNELTNVPPGSKVSFLTEDLIISSDGNQVVETGKYTVSNSTNPAASSGNFISVFEKRDGKYVCVRDMAVTDQPKK